MSTRFFEYQPNEICSLLKEKASKGTFLKPEKIQNHSDKGKGKEKKKEWGKEKKEKRKKAMIALLVFKIATLAIVFGRIKLLDAKGLFGDNIIKNPARCIIRYRYISMRPCQEGGPMLLVWILKCLVSVFIHASCCCRKLNENSLSLSAF